MNRAKLWSGGHPFVFHRKGIVSDAFDGAHTGVLSEIMKNEKQTSIQTRLKSTYNEKNGDKKTIKKRKKVSIRETFPYKEMSLFIFYLTKENNFYLKSAY